VTSLLLAHPLSLPDYGFDLEGGVRVGSHEVVPSVLQDANPAKPGHALCVATVVLYFLVGVGRAVVCQGNKLLLLEKDGGGGLVGEHEGLVEVVSGGAH